MKLNSLDNPKSLNHLIFALTELISSPSTPYETAESLSMLLDEINDIKINSLDNSD